MKVKYIRPDITLEIYMFQLYQYIYIYNYQGNHFRVFDNKQDIRLFLNNEIDNSIFDTENEEELDKYLEEQYATTDTI